MTITILASFAGCAGVNPVVEGAPLVLHSQSLDHEGIANKTKTIFYNTTNIVLWPTSHKIVLALDGEISPPIASKRYFQTYLDPREYNMTLTHWDIFTFTDQYQLQVEGNTLNVRLFNTALGTKYEVVDELPMGFAEDYKPAVSVDEF